MTEEDMAAAAALGITGLGIEGAWDSAVCSTGGDRPSLGVSQWEGERADRLLAAIPGGAAYAGRPWSALTKEDRQALSALLDSKAGRAAQWALLLEDAGRYVCALGAVHALFRSAYADAAGVPEYRAGYEARADRTYQYAAGL